MHTKHILLGILLFISVRGLAQQDASVSDSEKSGLSEAGLARIDAVMQSYVNEKKLPGMIAVIARRGSVVRFQNYGMMAEGKAMQPDAIFRIASMTKPLTSVAIMILCEEGRLRLDDPVSNYIPEFNDLNVVSGNSRNGLQSEKQSRPMTIRNLLTHTSGLGSGGENSYVDSLIRVANINEGTLKDEMAKLSKIPLKYQPGTHWQYGLSTDALACIIEVISGQPLDDFLKKRIFIPLKMVDTDYSVPEDKRNRVASVYSVSEHGMDVLNIPEINDVSAQVKNIRGNGGLFSTASDYLIFARMLLNKGEYNGVRILQRETVERMTSDQLTDELMPEDEFLSQLMKGMGFGLGFAVLADPVTANTSGSKGSYWWSGTANTYFYIDPNEELILIFMSQVVPYACYPVFREFRELVYESINR